MIDVLNCPECGKKMVWQNDFDVEEDEFTGIATYMSCDDCMISVEKITVIDSYKFNVDDKVRVVGNSNEQGIGRHHFKEGVIGEVLEQCKHTENNYRLNYYYVYSKEKDNSWYVEEKDLELVEDDK